MPVPCIRSLLDIISVDRANHTVVANASAAAGPPQKRQRTSSCALLDSRTTVQVRARCVAPSPQPRTTAMLTTTEQQRTGVLQTLRRILAGPQGWDRPRRQSKARRQLLITTLRLRVRVRVHFKPSQESENEIAEVVIVCEPEQASLMMGGLHPRGSLYERPINIESAKAQHAEFRALIREHGVKVLTVREILAYNVS